MLTSHGEILSGFRTSAWRSAYGTDIVAALVLLGAAVFVAAEMAARRQSTPDQPLALAPISLDGVPIRGSRQARVGVLVFSDFQCPFCARFSRETLPALDEAYFKKGIAFFAMRQAPLAIHPFARGAADLAACAQQAGRFWDLYDRLYADQEQLNMEHVLDVGESLGVSKAWLALCRATTGTRRVDEDLAAMHQLGVVSTPFFFIGRVLADGRLKVTGTVRGAQPLSTFRTAIESARRRQLP